jgi:hypothetical protein
MMNARPEDEKRLPPSSERWLSMSGLTSRQARP